MPENSELSEKETTITISPIPIVEIQSRRIEAAVLVYSRREKMTNISTSVIEPDLYGIIKRVESLIGKYDKALLIDTNFIDSYYFPPMKKQVYIENYVKEVGGEAAKVHPDFRGIQRSTILHLRSLPVFGMMGASMQ